MTPIKKIRRPSAQGPALLAVDVGNSETTVGVFQDEHLVLHWRLRSMPRTPDETRLLLRQFIAPEAIDLDGLPSVLCSVVPAVTADFASGLERMTGVVPVVVSANTVPSLPIRYHDPSAVGPDRLANAIAAREIYGAPAIVVDLGTATTFDVVGEEGDFLGGAITPGLRVSAEELFRRTARLGRVELTRPAHAIGRTTEESLLSGIVLGHAGMVDAMVSRILAELGGRAQVVATGGLATLLREEMGTIEHFDENLTLKGLRLIHESVAHPETLAAWVKKQETRRTARAKSVAKIEHEPVAVFDDEPLEEEIDEDDVIVVTGPEPGEVRAPRDVRETRPVRDRGDARPAPREARPPRGRRGDAVTPGKRAARGKAIAAVAPARAKAAPAPAPVAAPVPVSTADSATGAAGSAGKKRRRGRRGGRRSRR